MKSIRCGSGLGDSLYLQAAVRHLVRKGEQIEVCTDWPDVFRPLGNKVKVSPFRRQNVDIKAHYVYRKAEPRTDQFEDVCIRAGIRERVDFRLDWKPVNTALVEKIQAMSPVVAVLIPREPMNRKDGFARDLLPLQGAMQFVLTELHANGIRTVLVGSGDQLYPLGPVDLDLTNRTSVCDLLDIGYAVDGFLGYVSFFVPLAESLNKPALLVWARKGLTSKFEYVQQITPQKILHRPSSRAIFDDADAGALRQEVSAFCDEISRRADIPGQAGGDRRVGAERPAQ